MSVGRVVLRLAEESQLLAEEKWIIGALTVLKQQRNSLQIERLHLENLRATINKGELRELISSTNTEGNKEKPDDVLLQLSTPSLQTDQSCSLPNPGLQSTSLAQFDVPIAGIDDEMCNNEELNLTVNKSMFANQETEVFDTEEEEEDMENCEIDMNMFMYGK